MIPRPGTTTAEDEKAPIPYVRVKAGKDSLYKESESDDPKVILGAFHTDLRLAKVGVRKKRVVAPPGDKDKDKDKEKEKENKRGKSTFPDLEEGTCAADS